ncbi:conjugal transfer protein, partial [Klebsiella pneumoniae]|nr:conjugal transfer protein [Klebsiella pneumoniae]
IRTLSITMPNFSSLSSILNGYADEICSSVVSEVNSHIPSSIDPWDELTN